MPSTTTEIFTKEIAVPMVFSVYPTERKELLRLQDQLKLRTPFDVIRKALRESNLSLLPKTVRQPKRRTTE